MAQDSGKARQHTKKTEDVTKMPAAVALLSSGSKARGI
jgi:hypothetical protein